jgi:putative transposase
LHWVPQDAILQSTQSMTKNTDKLSYKHFYRRRLPHIQPEGGTFFITFRLANSLPMKVIEKLQEEHLESKERCEALVDKKESEEQLIKENRRFFKNWDDMLYRLTSDEKHLSNPQVADMVADSIRFRDGRIYDLLAFCIMPNHVHLVFTPLEEKEDKFNSLSKIMHSLKRYTAHEANLILGREGDFWQHENYDHYIRGTPELERIIKYVLNNPVKARLVDEWVKWKWSYCKYDM